MFTGQLGTSSSQLGNMVLGYGASIPPKIGAASVTYVPTHTIALNKSLGNNAFSNYNPAHTLFFNRVSGLSVGNTYAPSQTIHNDKIQPTSNFQAFRQALTLSSSKGGLSLLGLGQAVVNNVVFNRTAPSLYQYFQTLATTKTLTIQVSNAYAPTQQIFAPRVKGTSDILVQTDSVIVTNSKSAYTTYTLIDSVNIQVSKVINIGNTWQGTDNLFPNTAASFSVLSGFGLNHFVKHWKIYSLSLTDTLTQINHLIPGSIFIPTINGNTLTQSQSAVARKVNNVSVNAHRYNLFDAVIVNIVKMESVSNTLVYLPSHSVYVPMSTPNHILVPNLLVTKLQLPPTYVAPPTITFNFGQTLKKVFPYCTLQVPEQAITLPAPEFNDSEAYSGMFTIRRAMSGQTYTYIHKLDTSKLKYDFVVGVPKSMELENYLLNYNSRIHTLTNWKGEIWYVSITNNPMDLTAKSRYTSDLVNGFNDHEKVIVTLEFEGVRIH